MIQPVCGLAGRSEVEIQVLKSLGLSFSQDSLLVTFTGAHTGLFSNIYTVPVSQIPTPHGHVLSPLIMVMATQIPTATDSFKFSLLQGTHQYSYSVPQSCDSITHGQPQCAMVYHHTWYPLTYADLCSIRLYVGMSCCFTLHPASAPSPRAAKFLGYGIILMPVLSLHKSGHRLSPCCPPMWPICPRLFMSLKYLLEISKLTRMKMKNIQMSCMIKTASSFWDSSASTYE